MTATSSTTSEHDDPTRAGELHGVNVFTVDPADRAELVEHLRSMGDLAAIPGLLSLQILEEVGGDRLINHMRWASIEDFRAAEDHPVVASAIAAIARLVRTGDPGFFRVLHTQT